MCGIAGFLDPSPDHHAAELESRVKAMTLSLQHRGPDDEGAWVDPAAGIGLGSRRLAIIDVSPQGHQPMRSASGRYVITYNGEVYNSTSVAKDLESGGLAPAWRGHSDTEVMLAAIEAWGLERALNAFNGMFAFALWDTRDRRLTLVRDRLGIKPLYYQSIGGTLVFGSELRAIARHPAARLELDLEWLDRYLREIHPRSEDTVYRDVQSVRPGTYLSIDHAGTISSRSYWSLTEHAEQGHRELFDGPEGEAIEALDALLRDAVWLRRVSDVPIGVLLSGGIDSSTVLALLQHQSEQRIHSFSIGFPDAGLDEAPAARMIAAHVGSDHTELYATPDDIVQLIPSLARLTDQPQSDPSYLSNHLAYRLAGTEVTVALAGDGGDELFAGYHRHRWLPRVWRRLGWLPAPMRSQGGRAIRAVPPATWDRAFELAAPVIPARYRERTPGAKLHRLSRWMGARSAEEMYNTLSTRWEPSDRLLLGRDPTFGSREFQFLPLDGDFELLERVLVHELAASFVDTQLMKVDRASMAVGVEARVPFMDHRLVEMALRLPPSFKVSGETGKHILREVLHRYVPRDLYQRPKMGFHLPLSDWLRGPLRDWVETLLDPSSMRAEGILDPDPIQLKWQEHLSGKRDRVDHLWPVLMFRSWMEQRDEDPPDVH